ncbi:MAG: hypothetical protein HOO96_17910 [Polyangiaceae bacterium]|nr:hypothetical protein [Polyangiaceae bacterium]
MMPDEPRRLSDDPALRDAFAAARADVPDPERLARIEGLLVAKAAALAAAGGAGVASGAGASSAASTAGAAVKAGLLWKVGVGVALLVAVSGGATALVLSRPASVAPVCLVPSGPPGPTAAGVPEPDLSLAQPAPPDTVGAIDTAARGAIARPTATATGSSAPKPPEMELLNAAQRALAANPAEALAKCDELARTYPRGMMVEERERIAIEALVSLGRRAEAERRAAAFHKSFPRSSYGPRLDAILKK